MSLTQSTYWIVEAEYPSDEDHWQGQDRHIKIANNLGIKSIKWSSGRSTPKNWVGYSAEKPSPGRDINIHRWWLTDEMEAMAFYIACGRSIRKHED